MGPLLGEYKRRCYSAQLANVNAGKTIRRVLKTDLHEEAQGYGAILTNLPFVLNMVGIDRNMVVCENAQHHSKNRFEIVNADLITLPFEDETFDLIISISTIDHSSKETMIQYIQEMGRVLRNGGLLFISINNRHNSLLYYTNLIERRLGFNPLRTEFYRTCELTEIFQKNGFSVLTVDYLLFIPPFSRRAINIVSSVKIKGIPGTIDRTLTAIDKGLQKTRWLKNHLSHQILYVVRK